MVVNAATADAKLNAVSNAMRTVRGVIGTLLHPNWLVVQYNCPAVTDRCDLAIEPILLERQRAPALGHASKASKSGIALSALGELQAVVGICSKKIGLLHTN